MLPFLLIATRAEDAAADNEYDAFLSYLGVDESELVRYRLERDPLGDIDLDRFSGVLLGGSPFNASDPDETKSAAQLRAEADLRRLTAEVVERDFPMLGACYGIGVVGSHVGAVVDRTFGEPVGPSTITLTDAGVADPLLDGVPPVFEAFLGHKEAISDLPNHCRLLARSFACPVQMFKVGENVYATQFHPELDVEGLCTRIDVYRNAGYFSPDEVDKLKARARASSVLYPPRILANFAERYARR